MINRTFIITTIIYWIIGIIVHQYLIATYERKNGRGSSREFILQFAITGAVWPLVCIYGVYYIVKNWGKF